MLRCVCCGCCCCYCCCSLSFRAPSRTQRATSLLGFIVLPHLLHLPHSLHLPHLLTLLLLLLLQHARSLLALIAQQRGALSLLLLLHATSLLVFIARRRGPLRLLWLLLHLLTLLLLLLLFLKLPRALLLEPLALFPIVSDGWRSIFQILP